jgi:hypothetical protein
MSGLAGRMRQADAMTASSRPSSYCYVVDEPLLRMFAAEIQPAIPGAEVRLFGSRARGDARPDSDISFSPDATRRIAVLCLAGPSNGQATTSILLRLPNLTACHSGAA